MPHDDYPIRNDFPAFEITVERYDDGTTRVFGGPESWELRHRMLVDALAEVKRQQFCKVGE
jgi:hypothetical protein